MKMTSRMNSAGVAPVCLAVLFGLAFAGTTNAEGRSLSRIMDGWRADGVPVTLPHTWNAEDGADGPAPGYGYNAINWSTAKDEVGSYLRKRVTYTRSLPDPRPGRRYFFKCDGASISADVRVNGFEVGHHDGAYTAFAYELTAALQPSNNVLSVTVDNRRDPNVPTISADFTMFGGIYRDCWLIETDPVCIDPCFHGGPGVSVETDPATGAVRATVRVSGGESRAKFRVGDRTWETGSFVLPDFRLWSPETPVVYRLTVELENGDAVTVPFGFRRTEFRADGFYYLNGQKRKLRGVNRHQDRKGKGWCLSSADEDEDIMLIKAMGADALRTAHYPQSRHIYDLCDEKGLVCWVELPLTDELTLSVAHRANLEEMVREMVAQLGNHPSVCMWSVFNEIGIAPMKIDLAAPEVASLNRLFHELDPSRPTVAASMNKTYGPIHSITDALGFNFYPGWYSGDASDMSDKGVGAWLAANPGLKAIGISEYGAGASPNHHELPWKKVWHRARFHPEEYQAFVHAGQYRAIQADERVWGSFVWNMFDFAADVRMEGECLGMNDKGLVTYDRSTPKDAYYLYQANWTDRPVLRLVGSRAQEVSSNTVSVLVFSNCGDVSLSVNGKVVGTLRPDSVCCALFKDVRLDAGRNEIVATAGDQSAAAVWRLP